MLNSFNFIDMKNYDVIVVGGGPVGGFIAGAVSNAGFNVALLEEHREIGRPVQCAGLVSNRVFDILGEKNSVINEVKGAKVHSPSGRILDFVSQKPKAWVIDRGKFDTNIVEKAVNKGCHLALVSKVTSCKKDGDDIIVEVKKNKKNEKMKCRLLIGTDGVSSIVAKSFGFIGPAEVLSGFGAECLGNREIDKEFVDIIVGNNIAPGFFAWVIPTGEGSRIGLCTSWGKKSTYQYFLNLLSHPVVKARMGDVKIEHYITGAIPLGPIKKPYSDGVMLAGDAACQVKPLSGGGIYLGLLCGKHCASVAVSVLENDDVSESGLAQYEKRIRDDLGKELRRAKQLRKIYVGLKDKHLEEGFKVLDDEKLRSFISEHGDIDYPSGLTKAVLKKAPRLMKFAGPVLKSLI
jgi:geranylgeranyl reductase family protein